MYLGVFVLILNGTRGSFFCCLLAFYLFNENSFHKPMYFIMPNCRESKYVVHVSLLSPSHNQFRQWKLINSFLFNLDALSMSISTKISRRLPPVSSACRIKISPEKEERWTKYLYWTFTFCNHSLLSLTQYPTQGLCLQCPWPYSGSLGHCLPIPDNFLLSARSSKSKVAFPLVQLVLVSQTQSLLSLEIPNFPFYIQNSRDKIYS